jgi:flagellar M-ring protein FliF
VPVLSGVPIESTSEITDKLDQASIRYQLERGGTEITVAAEDLARARVALAKGGLPTAGRPGLELFDKPAYAMTDFTQRINYRRALEGELERTIGKMRGIASAQVHLALHETSTFRSATTPAEASVVLKLSSGDDPQPAVVQGIAHLVASSVDGLESEQVTVVDDGGRLLSLPNEAGSLLGLSSRQLANQREIEQHLREKAEEIVSQIVGRGNARVQVAANVNFDRVERTTQTLDPERQVAATEQKAEIVPGAQGGAGSSNTATTYENSRSTETYAGAVGTLRRLTVAVLVNDRKTGEGDSATFQPRTTAELARIDTLVRNAVGFDSARGDLMSVVSVPFAATPVPEPAPVPAPTLIEKVQERQSLILNTGALVFAFVIGFLALRSIRQPAQKTAAAPTGAQTLPHASHAGHQPLAFPSHPVADHSSAPRMVPELAAMQANAETRTRVSATVEQQPEVAAKMVRAWMKE